VRQRIVAHRRVSVGKGDDREPMFTFDALHQW
jgi:hypothetical protein